LRWRGLETGSRQTYTGTKLETADTAKGSLTGHRASPRPYYAHAPGQDGGEASCLELRFGSIATREAEPKPSWPWSPRPGGSLERLSVDA